MGISESFTLLRLNKIPKTHGSCQLILNDTGGVLDSGEGGLWGILRMGGEGEETPLDPQLRGDGLETHVKCFPRLLYELLSHAPPKGSLGTLLYYSICL